MDFVPGKRYPCKRAQKCVRRLSNNDAFTASASTAPRIPTTLPNIEPALARSFCVVPALWEHDVFEHRSCCFKHLRCSPSFCIEPVLSPEEACLRSSTIFKTSNVNPSLCGLFQITLKILRLLSSMRPFLARDDWSRVPGLVFNMRLSRRSSPPFLALEPIFLPQGEL